VINRALESDKERGDLRGQAIDYLNIGAIYIDMKKYDESINVLQLALPLFYKTEDIEGVYYAFSHSERQSVKRVRSRVLP
jgi:tetratricopeptide (TPR) repeat protein